MSQPIAASPQPPLAAPPACGPSSDLIARLGAICRRRGVGDLAARLFALGDWLGEDLASLEDELSRLPRGGSAARRSAHHLLDLGGKRLRPLCVALAAKLGTGFGPAARECALAVELIHNASLLHDDVIDQGSLRRGATTARAVYGNAASVVGGNWLLVTALERVERTGLEGIVGRTLATIGEMIEAEAIQLDNRGRLNPSRTDYFRVIHGKTAALFRWALFHGGLAGALRRRDCRALELYGSHLGVAFQLVDDLLDCTGDAERTGKALFADLRDGTMTYPFLLALERDPALRSLLPRLSERAGSRASRGDLGRRFHQALFDTGAVDDCRALAAARTRTAISCLDRVPAGPGRAALVTLAEAVVHRDG